MEKKAYRLEFTPSFIQSVDAEMEYWEQASPDKAKELLNGLVNLVDVIEKMPFSYPECEQLPTKNRIYRSALLSSRYRVIYKVKGNTVFYLSFFNTKRNPDSLKKLRKN